MCVRNNSIYVNVVGGVRELIVLATFQIFRLFWMYVHAETTRSWLMCLCLTWMKCLYSLQNRMTGTLVWHFKCLHGFTWWYTTGKHRARWYKTCRRESEVRMKEGWSDRQDTDVNRKRRNRIRARWRGGTEETDSEIESAKEQWVTNSGRRNTSLLARSVSLLWGTTEKKR